jgi:hypothetical protein
MRNFLLVLGALLAIYGALSLPFGRPGPKRTLDLFVPTPQLGVFRSGGITLLGSGLLLVFVSGLIPRR